MSTKLKTSTLTTMEELLASQPKIISLSRGQQIEGEIVSLSGKEIILDLGTKSEGIILPRDIAETQRNSLKVGDKLKAYVVLPENESGQVVLAFNQPQPQFKTGPRTRGGINWTRFLQAQNQKSKLNGKVLEVNKGGLIIEVDSIRGFLPNSQVGFELLSKLKEGMADLIGESLNVQVSEVDQSNNRLIFSQRGQVSEDILKTLKEFKKDTQVKGKIVAILPFGLVIDLKGVEGMVFISDVSWEKIDDLSKLYKTGVEIEAQILGIDEELGRVNLSIKHLSEDPFAKLAEKYPADEVVKGEITAVSDVGVVVALEGVEGLLPVSKMGTDTSYEVGKSMSFLVDSVDSQRRRVNLAPFVTSTAGLIYK